MNSININFLKPNKMKKIITVLSIIIILLFAAGSTFGQTWSTVGSTGMNGSVKCLITDNTNNVVYAGGAFTTADGQTVNYISKWNGTTWSAVGAGFNNTVWALTFYNNELYAGGAFTLSGTTTVNGIAKWNGNAWVAVGSGVAASGIVSALCVFNNELYVGGFFTSAGGAATSKNMAKWNGTTWAGVGGGMQDGVMALTVFNGALHAGGYFVVNNITFSLQYRIAKLSGTTWVNVGSKGVGDANAYWGVRTMSVYNNSLYAGGYFTLLDDGTTSAKHIAKWSGTAWSVVGSGSNAGITTTSSTYVLNSSIVYANTLYVGGTFTGAGGATANYIATWNGTAWGTAGTGLDAAVNAMTVYNNDLIVGGDFANAGGTAATRIAKWHITGAGTNEIKASKNVATNFPNPFSSSTLIRVDKEQELQNASLIIYDILGNETVTIEGINTNEISLDRNNLPAGVYFYSIKENNALVASGKLVIE